jgi:exopolysaccharide biosynthesis polyprenyl glycosylphosphotransferase
MSQTALARERAEATEVSPGLQLTRSWLTPLLAWGLDIGMLNLAFILAYWIRYPLGFPSQVLPFDYRPLQDFLPAELSLTAIMAVILPYTGLYRRTRSVAWMAKAQEIFSGTTVSVGLLIVLSYLSRLYAESRGLYLIAWALIIVLLATEKAVTASFRSWLHRRGIGVENLVVIGGSDMAKMIMQHVAASPGLGYRLLGFLDDCSPPAGRFGRFPHLGRIDELSDVVETHNVAEVIIALPTDAHQEVWDVVNRCQEHNVRYKVVPDLFEMSLSRVDMDEIAGIPLIGFRESTISGTDLVLKRAMDLVLGTLLLILSLPLWIIVPLAIKLDSRGPVLYRQIRVGKGGKHFTFYKFRSMRQGADQEWHSLRPLNETDGPILKIRNDPRLTRVGRVLRRTSIDELPQILNVLRGEMSLVGPRPPLPAEVLQYEPWQHKRLSVAGGLTGLWQVSGRSHLNFEEMVMMDLYYIENWSLGLDLRILLRTIPAILTGTGSF